MVTRVRTSELRSWRNMLAAGKTYHQISMVVGRSDKTVRYHLEPGYAEKSKAAHKARYLAKAESGSTDG